MHTAFPSSEGGPEGSALHGPQKLLVLRQLGAPLRLGLHAQRALPHLSGLPQRRPLLTMQLHTAGADTHHARHVRLAAC